MVAAMERGLFDFILFRIWPLGWASIEHGLEIGGERCFELDDLTIGMWDLHPPRMERLARETHGFANGLKIGVVGLSSPVPNIPMLHPIQKGLIGLSIEQVAQNGVTSVMEVHPNLMRSPCMQ